jgi:hypothetical protein
MASATQTLRAAWPQARRQLPKRDLAFFATAGCITPL